MTTKTYEITRPRFRFSKAARRVAAAAFAVLGAAALFLTLAGGNPASAAMVGWDYSKGKPPKNFSCKSVQNIERAYRASYQKYPGENGGAKVGHGSGGMILLRAA